MKKFFQVLGIVTLLLVGLYYIEECSGKKDQSEAVEDVQDDLEMEKSVHLKFKGVPIDGTLKEFISRMERKGFEHRSSYDSKERLVGDFAGIKQCTVYVETLDNSDLVSRIIVEFPKQERWEELFDNYKNLKSMLMEKYGNFSSCVERFQNSYIRTDEYRMLAVHMCECMYKTKFSIAEGDITLSIDYEEWGQGFVLLKYQDKINSAIIREAAIEDL